MSATMSDNEVVVKWMKRRSRQILLKSLQVKSLKSFPKMQLKKYENKKHLPQLCQVNDPTAIATLIKCFRVQHQQLECNFRRSEFE